MKNYLILHGHFYQPPRENPSTGIIPRQESAAPYHDWNARITKECYGANAYSRVLTEDGRILDIINNYENISFNIGPTLINWLQYHSPNVYERIIEADKKSIEKNGGHGNAIAQGFNHTILPLDTHNDAEIQIYWGIKNFEKHFSRDPEGFWLPEAAVNNETADMLIKYGIKFIILSPGQAKAVTKTEGGSTLNNWEEAPDPSVPYLLKRKKGNLAVFFYHPALAEGISFNHYLHNAENLYRKLLEYSSSLEGNLVHAATDGEIYGHHEPFGDMCLAALSKIAEKKGDFIFTNYGKYLFEHPPVREIILEKGEERKGTSWSCFHGVSRWYKDCGCSTGGQPGWNQRWRTPLRNALRYIGEEIDKAYTKEISKMSNISPPKLLADYHSVVNMSRSPREFAVSVLRDPERTNIVKLLKLMEGQRMKLFSFTSCGWFFSDIYGIESVQNMKYASKALQLYKDILSDSVRAGALEILESAVSNRGKEITGKRLFPPAEEPYPEGFCASLYFAAQKNTDTYGIFRLKERKNKDRSFCIETVNTLTTEHFMFEFTMPDPDDEYFRLEIASHGTRVSSLKDLDKDLKEIILQSAAEKTEKHPLLKILGILKYCIFLDSPVPSYLNGNTQKLIEDAIRKVLKENTEPLPPENSRRVMELIKYADLLKIPFDKTIPQNIVMNKLKYIRANGIRRGRLYIQTVKMCNALGIYCDDVKQNGL